MTTSSIGSSYVNISLSLMSYIAGISHARHSHPKHHPGRGLGKDQQWRDWKTSTAEPCKQFVESKPLTSLIIGYVYNELLRLTL